MLSRLVITFLPRSKRLLISWLQSPSAVILEPPKIKSATVSSSISHEYPLISMHRLRAAFQSPFLTSASPSALETPQPPLHQSASPLRTLCTSVSLPHRSATPTQVLSRLLEDFPRDPPTARHLCSSPSLGPRLSIFAPPRPGPAHSRREPRRAVWRQTYWSATCWTRVSAFWFGIRIPEGLESPGRGRDSNTLRTRGRLWVRVVFMAIGEGG